MFTLQQVDKESILISHAPQNPTLEFVESINIPTGVKNITSQGGGSTIDVGKWLANKFNLYHTAIPTTAGTGSEVTKFCVLMVQGKKKTFEVKVPDNFILNPSLVVSLPPMYTVASGLDALAQCLEAHWSRNATPESWLYDGIGYELIVANLRECLKDPTNIARRSNMLLAAHFSGKAINITKTNVCHAISYPLTELYGIPHGIACAMSLPYFAKKFTGKDLFSFIQGLIYVPPIDKERIADEVIKSPKLLDCPMKVTRNDIIQSLNFVV